MKFSKWGRGFLATAVSAGVGVGLSSCGTSNTVDYVFLASAKNSPGQIDAFLADSITGALTRVSDTPTTTGQNPVALVTSPTSQTLYVVNHDDNTVQMFGIGGNAKLTSIKTYPTPGSDPVAVGINPAGTFLFVADTYAAGYSTTVPGPGALVVYPITKGSGGTDASLGSPTSYTIGTAPTAINVLSTGSTVYVTDQLTAPASGCTTGQGAVVALSISSAGALTPVAGSPFCAGVAPSSIATHPIGSFLYVTDRSQNQLIGYVVSTSGALVPFVGGPVPTGVSPDNVTVEPRGLYMYVVNHAGTVQSYSIAQGTGVASTTGTYPTLGAFPQCVIVEPALARFVYTADYEGIGITGFKLDPNTGMLTGTENSPYAGTGLSTCLAATSHGNHPIIHVQGTAGD